MRQPLAGAVPAHPRGRPPKHWGDWKFNRSTLVLNNKKAPWYTIDLGRVRTSAQMLDWIFQLYPKVWITPQDIHDLLLALDDLFDPQSSLCSWGTDKRLNKGFLRSRHAARLTERVGMQVGHEG
jgi:hypothetical protein